MKTLIGQQFEELIVKSIWADFKNMGYQKMGNNFRFYDSSGWGKIVNFQKSAFGDASNISFTINTGLYLVKADMISEEPKASKFLEPDCIVRKRIGV